MVVEYKAKISGDISSLERSLKKAEGEIQRLNDDEVLIKLTYDKNLKDFNKVFDQISKTNPEIAIQFQYDVNKKILEEELAKIKNISVDLDIDNIKKQMKELGEDILNINKDWEDDIDGETDAYDRMIKSVQKMLNLQKQLESSGEDSNQALSNLGKQIKDIVIEISKSEKLTGKLIDTKNLEAQNKKIQYLQNTLEQLRKQGAIDTVSEDSTKNTNESVRALDRLKKSFADYKKANGDKNLKGFWSELKKGIDDGNESVKQLISDLQLLNKETDSIDIITGGRVKKGGIEGLNTVLLASSNGKKRMEEIEEIKERLSNLGSEASTVAKTIDYVYDEETNTLLEIQEKAKGAMLGQVDFEGKGFINPDIFKATNEQIFDMIKNLWKLNQAGIGVEFNLENVFFDEKKGFSFIDIDTSTAVTEYANFQEFLEDLRIRFFSDIEYFYEAANDIDGSKLTEGFTKNFDNVGQQVAKLVDIAEQATADAQKSNSPSKVAENLGDMWGEGYADGILKHKDDVANNVRELVMTGVMTAKEILDDLPNIFSDVKYKDLIQPVQGVLSEFFNADGTQKDKSSISLGNKYFRGVDLRGKESLGKEGIYGQGSVSETPWFSSSLDIAKEYAGTLGEIYEIQLNLNKVMAVDAQGEHWNHILYLGEGEEEESKKLLELYDELTKAKQRLIDDFKWDGSTKQIGELYTKGSKDAKQASMDYQKAKSDFDKAIQDSERYGYTATDDLAKMAKELGYQAIVIKNVMDSETGKIADNMSLLTGDMTGINNAKLLDINGKIIESYEEKTTAINNLKSTKKELNETPDSSDIVDTSKLDDANKRVQELTENNQELNNQLEEQKRLYKELQEENDTLRSQNREMVPDYVQKELNLANEELGNTRHELEDVTEEFNKASKEAENLQNQVNSLRESLDIEQTVSQRYFDEKLSIEVDRDQYKQQNADLEKRVLSLQDELSEARSELKQALSQNVSKTGIDVSDEKSALEKLRDILDVIIDKVEIKTSTFDTERVLVIDAINTEIQALKEFESHLEGVAKKAGDIKINIDIPKDLHSDKEINLGVDGLDSQIDKLRSSIHDILEILEAVRDFKLGDATKLKNLFKGLSEIEWSKIKLSKSFVDNLCNLAVGTSTLDSKNLNTLKKFLKDLAGINLDSVSKNLNSVSRCINSIVESLNAPDVKESINSMSDAIKTLSKIDKEDIESAKRRARKESSVSPDELKNQMLIRENRKYIHSNIDELNKAKEKLKDLTRDPLITISDEGLKKIQDDLNIIDDQIEKLKVIPYDQPILNKDEIDEATKSYSNFAKEIKANDKLVKNTQWTTTFKKIAKALNDNGRYSKEARRELQSYYDELNNNGRVSAERLNEINAAFNRIIASEEAAGRVGKSFGQGLAERIKSITQSAIAMSFSMYDVINYGRQALSTIKDLDYELVDLRKTTSMNNSELEQFYQNSSNLAKSLGVTTQEIISQASAWSRLGFNTKEQAETMAALSSQFATISPGMDTEKAQSGLVSLMKAYQIDVADVESEIMDNVNLLGNRFAESNEDIIDGMERAGAALAATGTSLKDSLALFTGGQEILQNSEKMGTALRSISMRIRGYSEESTDGFEELDEELTNITGDLIDLTKTASNPNGISIFKPGSTTEFKSLVDYLGEVSEIWDEMTDKQQNDFLQKAFAKTQAQAGAAIITNFSQVRKALEEMEQSFGSADAEMEIASDSITFKLNAFQQTWVDTLTTLIDRGAIGDILDFLTRVSEVLGDIITNADLLIPILGGIGGTILSATNNGLIKQVFDENGNKTDKFSIDNFEFKELSDIINQVKNNGFNGLISSILGGEEATNQISSFKDILDSIKEIYEQDPDNVSSAAEAAAENLGIDFTDAMSDAIENAEDGEEALANFTAGLSTTGIKSKIAAVGMNLLTTALQGAAIALASFAVEYIISSLTELYNISDRLAEKSKELASEFNNTKNDIDGYKDKISELYEIINNNESSTESVTEARKELLRIQKEMIEKYGEESNVVRDVTDAIYGQVAALDRLSARKWRETLNKFEEEYTKDLGSLRGWINPFANAIEGYDSNVERMLDEYENSNLTIGQWSKESFGLDDKEYNKFIRKFEKLGGVTQELIGGSELNFNLSGNAEEVYNQLLDVQNLLDEFNIDNDAITTQVQNALEDVEPKLNYKDLFDQYTLQEEILPDKNYNQIYSDLMKANDEWKDSFEKGTQEDQENAIKNISELYGKINQIQDESVKDFLLGMYPELQSILDEYEFKVNILPNIKTEGLEGKDGDYITKILSTKGLQEGEAAFNVIKADLEEAGIVSADDADEIQKIIDLLVKWGILQSNVTEETKNTNSILNQIASKQNIDSTLGLDFSVDENSDEIADSIATEVNDWMRSNKQMVETSLNIDIDSVDLEDLPDEFKDLNDELKAYRSMANFVVKSNKKFQASFDDLSSNLEGYKNLIDEANQSNKEYLKSTGEYSEVISKLTADVSGLTGLDFTNDNILEFLNQGENFNLLTQAINGSEEALRSLQTQAIQFTGNEFDISAKLNTDEFNDEYNSFVNWLSTADLGTIEGTATFNNQPFVQSMLNLVAIGRKTASDIEAIFSSLGVEAKITYDEVEVPSVISEGNAKSGKFVSVPGVGYIETSTGKVQTTKIKVPKISYVNNTRSTVGGSGYRRTSAATPSGGSGGSGGGGNGGGDGSGSEPQEETFDWIETKISRIERSISNLDGILNDVYSNWSDRNAALVTEFAQLEDEIETLRFADQAYYDQLVGLNLPKEYFDKVLSGALSIETITDEDLKKKLQDALSIVDKMNNAVDQQAEKRRAQFDLMQTSFNNMLKRYQNSLTSRQNGQDMADALWEYTKESSKLIPEMVAEYYTAANDKISKDLVDKNNQLFEMSAHRAAMAARGAGEEALDEIDRQIEDLNKDILNDSIQLSRNVGQAFIEQFELIQKKYDDIIENITSTMSRIDSMRRISEAQGYATSGYFLQRQKEEQEGIYNQRASKYNEMKLTLEARLGSGDFTGPDDPRYQEALKAVNKAYDEMYETLADIAELNKEIRELEWMKFDDSTDAISKWREDNNFLIDIMTSERDLFEDVDRDVIDDFAKRLGNAIENDMGELEIEPPIRFNDTGNAVLGLHVSNLQAYESEIGRVNTAIEQYRKELDESGGTDQAAKKRLDEAILQQRELVKGYYDERQAIKSVYEQYYNKMLDYLNKVISKRKEALQAEKDLYDYEKNIRDQTKNVSDLEKQVLAIQGDNSEEGRNQRQKLEKQLKDAQEKLQETEYDKWKQIQENTLDKLSQEYSNMVEDILKGIEKLVDKAILSSTTNANNINDTISKVITGDSSGSSTLTNYIGGVKDSLYSAITDYEFMNRVADENSTINKHLSNIDEHTQNYYKAANDNGQTTEIDANENRQRNTKESDYQSLFRLYNSQNGQHLYTNNGAEKDMLVANGWNFEGEYKSWANSQKPIYRYFNGRDYMYTTIPDESSLTKHGYKYESIVGYATDDGSGVPVYRLYNPNDGTHHFTTDSNERQHLINAGWKDENEVFRLASFAKGGEIASQFGEDGFILARKGEHILSLEQIKEMKDVLKAYNPLADAIKGVRGISGFGSAGTIENMQLTLNLPNVTNYEEFKTALKNDNGFAQWMSEATIGQIAGHGSLSKYRF